MNLLLKLCPRLQNMRLTILDKFRYYVRNIYHKSKIVVSKMSFAVLYGENGMYSDVTHQTLLSFLMADKTITIPAGDHERAARYGDPLPGVKKHIRIFSSSGHQTYPAEEEIFFDLSETNLRRIVTDENWLTKIEGKTGEERLSIIHQHIALARGGRMSDEYPEQVMISTYLSPEDVVLELGSNIGRSTMVIASIVKQENFVTLECDPVSFGLLTINKHLNGFSFFAECAALSYVDLYQDGWITSPIPNPGWKRVQRLTFEEIERHHDLKFNALVIDAEGALYYILRDRPEILAGINKIIIENDYLDIEHYIFVRELFEFYGFKNVYSKQGGWTMQEPCSECFFQVWMK